MNTKLHFAAGLLALAFTLTGCEPAPTTPSTPPTTPPAQPAAADKAPEAPATGKAEAGSGQKGAADVAPPK